MGERVSSISNGYSTAGRQKRLSPDRPKRQGIVVIQQDWGDARNDGAAAPLARRKVLAFSVPRAEGLT